LQPRAAPELYTIKGNKNKKLAQKKAMATAVSSAQTPSVALRDLPSALPFNDYDILTRITRDHEAFRDAFLTARSPGLDLSQRLAAVHALIRLVSVHSMAEEQVLYPLARAFLPEGNDSVTVDIAFHVQLRHDLSALSWSSASDPALEAKLLRLWATLSAHMEEEETQLLPAIARHVPHERRVLAGRLFASVKLVSCSRPHIAAPTTPPLNVLANVFTAPIDWALDMWRFGNAPPL
jgi:hemerythrin-like domain-containing protein